MLLFLLIFFSKPDETECLCNQNALLFFNDLTNYDLNPIKAWAKNEPINPNRRHKIYINPNRIHIHRTSIDIHSRSRFNIAKIKKVTPILISLKIKLYSYIFIYHKTYLLLNIHFSSYVIVIFCTNRSLFFLLRVPDLVHVFILFVRL